jgi:hypothetical protein
VGDYTIPQELNRYSYVLDNPLSLTDPSGLCFLGCFWDQSWFRDVIALAVGLVLLQPQLDLYNAFQILGIPTGGLVFETGVVIGGVTGAIATGTLKGAALGALEGGLFAEVGNVLQLPQFSNGFVGIGHTASVFIAHGLVGGLVSTLGGSRFGAGFLAGGLGIFGPQPVGGQPWEQTFEDAVESAALGGAGSVIGGGKFDNGAVTGAFGYLFNSVLHDQEAKIKNIASAVIDINPAAIFDFHEYLSDALMICSSEETSCNFDNVQRSALATQIPGYNGLTQSGGSYPVTLPGIGYIGNASVIVEGNSIFNITDSGHWLYYGFVDRTIIVRPEGIYIQTFGMGFNILGPAVAAANQAFGPTLFNLQDDTTRSYYQSHFQH